MNNIKDIFNKLMLENGILNIDINDKKNKLDLIYFNSTNKSYKYNYRFPQKIIKLLRENIIDQINSIDFMDYNIEDKFKISSGLYVSEKGSYISLRFKVGKVKSVLFKFIKKNMCLFDFDVLYEKERILFLYNDVIYEDLESIIIINSMHYIPKEIKIEKGSNLKDTYNIIKMLSYWFINFDLYNFI